MNYYGDNVEGVYGDLTTEEYATTVTNYINKSVITKNSTTDATFKGSDIINYSIAPAGVAKALIDTTKGVVTFEKYDTNWYGDVDLTIEATTGTTTGGVTGEHYINHISVAFDEPGITGVDGANVSFASNKQTGSYNQSQGDLQEEYYDLSEDDDTTGGATFAKVPAGAKSRMIPHNRVGSFEYKFISPEQHEVCNITTGEKHNESHRRIGVKVLRNGKLVLIHKCKLCGAVIA